MAASLVADYDSTDNESSTEDQQHEGSAIDQAAQLHMR
jgi:hypothetical protein